jgi:nicotinate-nucleotide adenylyltransferase
MYSLAKTRMDMRRKEKNMDMFPMFSFPGARDMRIGLLGGTFDPIHLGHLYAARQALSGAKLDVAVLMPAGTPPHKSAGEMAPAVHRLRMACLAAAGRPGIAVSDLEIGGDRPDYTADTLAKVQGLCGPGCTLHFIVGADALAEMSGWRDPERLFSLAEIVAVFRPGTVPLPETAARALRERYGARVVLLEVPGMDVSSSEVRERIRAGLPVDGMLPREVAAYILENGLYREPEHG